VLDLPEVFAQVLVGFRDEPVCYGISRLVVLPSFFSFPFTVLLFLLLDRLVDPHHLCRHPEDR
jgi:hypothetical protein